MPVELGEATQPTKIRKTDVSRALHFDREDFSPKLDHEVDLGTRLGSIERDARIQITRLQLRMQQLSSMNTVCCFAVTLRISSGRRR